MPRGWIRAHRAGATVRLGNEAREIADLGARRQHLASGLARLVGTAALALITDEDFAPGHRGRIAAFAADGHVQPVARAHIEHENEFNPALSRLIGLVDGAALGDLCVRPRAGLVGDARWRSSEYYNEYFRPARLQEAMYAARRTGRRCVDGGVLVRARGERAFDEEDRAVVELFFQAHGELWASPTNANAAPGEWALALPPRLRRVLDLLLLGLAEKAVADRLGLTPATTHQYVVEI